MEFEFRVSKLTKAKIDRIALQHHRDNQIYEKYLAQENSKIFDDKEFDLGHNSEKIISLPSHIQADKIYLIILLLFKVKQDLEKLRN